MRPLGMIGGIAPESTIQYYRLIVARWRGLQPDGSYPPVFINSIDMTRMLDLIGAGDLRGVTDYLAGEVGRLARAGAEVGLLASNTPHVVFDELQRRSPMPLLSIVETAARAIGALGLRRVGLFGTRFTMQGAFYPAAFDAAGIGLVLPRPEEQAFIHGIYMGELVLGVFRPETRARLLEIAGRLARDEGIEGLVLGGTELPLILDESHPRPVPFLDTTRLHVEAAVAQMLEEAT